MSWVWSVRFWRRRCLEARDHADSKELMLRHLRACTYDETWVRRRLSELEYERRAP